MIMQDEPVAPEDYQSKPYKVETNESKLKIEGGRKLETRIDVGVMLKVIGAKIYSSNESAYREQLTNAISHGCIPVLERGDKASVMIEFDYYKRTITVQENNGMGIPYKDMENIVIEIGSSSNHDRSRSGQHGMGLFSFLKLSDTTILETWSHVTDERYAFISEGGATWEEVNNRELETTGTLVKITLKKDVDMTSLAKSTKAICEFQKAKTWLIVKGCTEDNTEVRNYGRERNEWWKGDGNYEFGGDGLFEKKMLEIDGIGKVKTLEGRDMKIYIGMKEFKNSEKYIDEDTKLFLCNVPIDNRFDKFGFPCVWVNLTSERTYTPPASRDTLESDSLKLVDVEIEQAIKKWISGIKITNIKDLRKHEDASIFTVRQCDKFLPTKTRDFFDGLRSNCKVWRPNVGGDEIKNKRYEVISLLPEKNVFLVNCWNTRYFDSFKNYFKGEFVFVQPYVKASDRNYADELNTIKKYFKDAKTVRKTLKIPLVKININKTDGKATIGDTERTVKVRTPGYYNYGTEDVKLNDLTENVWKIGISWNWFNSNVMRGWNSDRSIQDEDGTSGSVRGWFNNSNYRILGNKSFNKITDELCSTDDDVFKRIETSEFRNHNGKNISGKDIVEKVKTNRLVRITITTNQDLLEELKEYGDLAKEELCLFLPKTIPNQDGVDDDADERRYANVDFNRLCCGIIYDREMQEANQAVTVVNDYPVRWGISGKIIIKNIDKDLAILKQSKIFKNIYDIGQFTTEQQKQIIEYLPKVDKQYKRLFVWCMKQLFNDYDYKEQEIPEKQRLHDVSKYLFNEEFQVIVDRNNISNNISTRHKKHTTMKTNKASDALIDFFKKWFEPRLENPKTIYMNTMYNAKIKNYQMAKNPKWRSGTFRRGAPMSVIDGNGFVFWDSDTKMSKTTWKDGKVMFKPKLYSKLGYDELEKLLIEMKHNINSVEKEKSDVPNDIPNWSNLGFDSESVELMKVEVFSKEDWKLFVGAIGRIFGLDKISQYDPYDEDQLDNAAFSASVNFGDPKESVIQTLKSIYSNIIKNVDFDQTDNTVAISLKPKCSIKQLDELMRDGRLIKDASSVSISENKLIISDLDILFQTEKDND